MTPPTPHTPHPLVQDPNGLLTVQRWDGTAWGVVGSAGLSTGQARYVALALDGCAPPSTGAWVLYQVRE